jgi:hypothetical protein
MLGATWATSAFTQPLSRDDMLSYGVQSICVDEAGKPTYAFPIEADCAHSRLQSSSDIATYRKHDWPNAFDIPAIAHGYQASDSVLQRRGSRQIVVQTFDFGTDGRSFGHFDGGHGDGGQTLLIVNHWAAFAMTEDGGAGVQWFIGDGCRDLQQPDSRFRSWLIFRDDIRTDEWRSAVAHLNITTRPEICPRRFNAAFTRYRLDRIGFPFRIISLVVTNLRHQLDVVVSEHYGGSDIRSADHLERFFLAKGLGLVRWERWANGNLAQTPATREAARTFAQTARCPTLSGYGAPDQGWLLVDCRTWTTLVRQTQPWSVDNYNWPALSGFGPIE